MILESNERECQGNLVLRINNFEDYNFKDDPGHVHYTICDYVVKLGYDEITGDPVPDGQGGQAYTIFKFPKENGSIKLTSEIVEQWGADDQIIFDFISHELNLILV